MCNGPLGVFRHGVLSHYHSHPTLALPVRLCIYNMYSLYKSIAGFRLPRLSLSLSPFASVARSRYADQRYRVPPPL